MGINYYTTIVPYAISLIMAVVSWPMCQELYKESANAKRKVKNFK